MNIYTLDNPHISLFYSENNKIIRHIEDTFRVKLAARGESLKILDDSERKDVIHLFKLLDSYIEGKKDAPTVDELMSLVRIKKDAPEIKAEDLLSVSALVPAGRKPIYPKTLNQKMYVHNIEHNDVVFTVGPAGTGKTYLAMAVALKHMMDKTINKIILTRPAVEAGESLGFLPGDLEAKINPYLRPLYDALFDIIPSDTVSKFLERGQIEVAPLAYMRGRTLNDSFLILDEAQNSTYEQMKMFLTRIGFNSKAIITGDITQIDLPAKKSSGLVKAVEILQGIEGIGFTTFNDSDVVRHKIVQRIIKAYQRYEDKGTDRTR